MVKWIKVPSPSSFFSFFLVFVCMWGGPSSFDAQISHFSSLPTDLSSSSETGEYQNVGILRTNAMKYLHNYFFKGQLTKMFFL